MSDAGIYAAIEADIVTKLTGISGVNSISASMSANDLVYRQGIQKPAIGIVHQGTEVMSQTARGVNAPQFRAKVNYQVTVAANDARGAISSRPLVQTILEAIRDRLHFKQPSGLPVPNIGLYRFVSEGYPEEQPQALIVAAANYSLEVMLAN